MPEGDTIFRAAATMNRVLANRVVTAFDCVFPLVMRVADQHAVVGRTIESVTSRGKHLLMEFSGGLVLHTHMRMNGSWHLYPEGARWQRPLRDARVVVGCEGVVAVGFTVPIVELLPARDLARHEGLRALGPDLLAADFDRDEVARRIRAHGRDAIGDVLLNQRVVAGVGNVFRSEVLFLAGVNPLRAAGDLDDETVVRVIGKARELLRANVMDESQTLSRGIGRRTTRSMDPDEKLWVYRRSGRPCRRCGAPIQVRKSGADARIVYWCPMCQPETDSEGRGR